MRMHARGDISRIGRLSHIALHRSKSVKTTFPTNFSGNIFKICAHDIAGRSQHIDPNVAHPAAARGRLVANILRIIGIVIGKSASDMDHPANRAIGHHLPRALPLWMVHNHISLSRQKPGGIAGGD